MAAVAVSALSTGTLLLSLRLPSSSSPLPAKSPISSIRASCTISSSRRFFPAACTISSSRRFFPAACFPSSARARGRCITTFAPRALADDPPFENVKIEEDLTLTEDRGGGADGGGFGGGDGGKGDKGDGGGGSGKEKKAGMLMSQKITLGYAALLGVGGLMGYIKRGSHTSLASGVGSSLFLYFVYSQLPVRPALASSLGLGLSGALLAVMGARFKTSGKLFPAGVVSIVSFVMAAGYLHGFLRTFHH